MPEVVQVPEYCALGEGDVKSINAWLGPAGTVTPLHTDPHHNLFVQVWHAAHFTCVGAPVSATCVRAVCVTPATDVTPVMRQSA